MTRVAGYDALQQPDIYPDPTFSVEVRETHISLIYLTDHYAYKIKKPVTFDFVDFATRAAREHFCRRELELNRRFAPDLYLAVVPLTAKYGRLRVNNSQSPGEAIDWAVKMKQFPQSQQCDRLLAAGALDRMVVVTFAKLESKDLKWLVRFQ